MTNRILSATLALFSLTALASLRFFEVELRSIGRRRNPAAIGLINLIYNLARYEQIVRLKLLPSRSRGTA